MLIQCQMQGSVNVNTLLNTTTDCLRFITEFFEVISQSVPHIYHSALQLAPQSSIVQKLYSQQIYSPGAKVLTGIPDLWDLCVASAGPVGIHTYPVWSPCGQFIAAPSGDTVQLQNSDTLETISTLKPPHHLLGQIPKFLAFSPGGHLLSCSYHQHK